MKLNFPLRRFTLVLVVTGLIFLVACAGKKNNVQTIEKSQQSKSIINNSLNSVPKEKPKDEPIKITFAGDTIMDWSVRSDILKKGPDNPFLYVKEEVISSDYAVVNLETAVTTRNNKFPKQFNFKADPAAIQGIKDSGFDLVSLANNHAMDYREEGLIDTFSSLKQWSISYFGAGQNEGEAYSAKTVLIKNKKIKFLAFSRVLPDGSWYASPQKPGIASGYQLDRIINIISTEKNNADYILVYIHWGSEAVNIPDNIQKLYAKKMIDAGADAIIGSHPHVLQGFEFYKGKPIAYSLGNFLFPNYVSGKQAETGLLGVLMEPDGIKLSFKPYLIKNNQIVSIDKSEEDKILSYLKGISFGININGYEITPQ